MSIPKLTERLRYQAIVKAWQERGELPAALSGCSCGCGAAQQHQTSAEEAR